MAAVVDAPVEHRRLQQLHGRRHRDVALTIFLERQLHALLVALRLEGLDKGAIIGDGAQIVLRVDLGQPRE